VRLRFINGSAMSYFDVRIPGLKMTVVAADGQYVEPVSVDEFRIAVAETYDVLVEPAGDEAYTIFAQSMDRTGYARGTLTSTEGRTAPVPPMDPRPLVTMDDMGMGGMDHGSMGAMGFSSMASKHGGHGSMQGAPDQMQTMGAGSMAGMDHGGMQGKDHSKMQGMQGQMQGMDHGSMQGMDHGSMQGMDHGSMQGMDHGSMQGMDHSKMQGMQGMQGQMQGMDHGSMQGMDHSKMQGMDGQMRGMDHGQMKGMDGMQSHPASEDGNPLVDMQAMNPVPKLDDPGIGLRENGRRVLTYADLRSTFEDPDGREPSRTIELHLTGHMEKFVWSFDGIKFSDAKPVPLKYGERVRIVLINDTMMSHPIHLHGMWSDLEDEQGNFMVRKHTIDMPPGSKRSYRVTADALGRWAYHCHLLYHMEMGMFREVRVQE
jgi:FtsP/CotA-like multicopper oxidase with cupredoxin domain